MTYFGVIEPSFPSIAIHKGWLDSQKSRLLATTATSYETQKSDTLSLPSPNSPDSPQKSCRKYEFVNTNTQGKVRNKKLKKLVRSYAGRRDNREGGKPTTSKKSLLFASVAQRSQVSNSPAPGISIPRRSANHSNPPALLGYTTALCLSDYPIDMQPRAHRLLEQYLISAGNRLYPKRLRLRMNPIRIREWLHFAITDAAMMQAMLYAGAVYVALLEGKAESWDMLYHQNKTVSILNQRFGDPALFYSDSTLGAISCLALGEALTGNQLAWSMHMRGLQEIIRKRGGILPLRPLLLAKLQRTDIVGALDYAATPFLQLKRSERPPTWSALPNEQLENIRNDMTVILEICGIHQDLIDIMIDLAHFSAAISSVQSGLVDLNISSYCDDTYSIESRLLNFTAHSSLSTESNVGEACRLGGLLYVKSMLEEFPHSKTGPSILLRKLQESLRNIPRTDDLAPMIHWLSAVGEKMTQKADGKYYGNILADVTPSMISPDSHEINMGRLLPLELVF